jgi:hypothetical protein
MPEKGGLMSGAFLKYPRWCPKCGALHPAIWKECTVCKAPLVSSLWRLPGWVFKNLLAIVVVLALLVSAALLVYFSKKPDPGAYSRGCQYARAGEYREAWSEFARSLRS